MLENCDKTMYFRFNFDACPLHTHQVCALQHLTNQNLSVRALFCHNSLAIVNMQLLIYNYSRASLSMRITESILAVIHIISRYENQFLSLSHTVNAAVSVKFDSHELR